MPSEHDSEAGRGEGPCTGPTHGGRAGQVPDFRAPTVPAAYDTPNAQEPELDRLAETNSVHLPRAFGGCVLIIWFPRVLKSDPKVYGRKLLLASFWSLYFIQ